MSNNNKRSVSTIKVLHGDWEHVIVIREVRFQVNSHICMLTNAMTKSNTEHHYRCLYVQGY